MGNLLINEQPLIVLPKLATKIGLNAAIALQQLHFWLQIYMNADDEDHFHDGRWWIYNSAEGWQKNFPFWSTRTIQRVFKALREATPHPLILTGNFNKRGYDKTLWYTINYAAVDKLSALITTKCPIDNDKVSTPIPETTHRLTKDPPSAELVKPPLKNTEKLYNPESNPEEKPLEGVIIEEPDETIPIEYAIIEDLNPYANTLFCPVCNCTQPWPRTKTARKKRPRLICGGCGAYFHITMEGNDFVYCWKLPEREWRVIIEGHDSYPCTENQLADFKKCWRADSKEFLSSLDWALGQSWMTKDKVIARATTAWRTNMERKALKEHVKAMVPEPKITEIDCPEWFE